MDEDLFAYTDGKLQLRDIIGKHLCSSCIYVIRKTADVSFTSAVDQPSVSAVPYRSVRNTFHDVLDVLDKSTNHTLLFSKVEEMYKQNVQAYNSAAGTGGTSKAEKELGLRIFRSYLCPVLLTRSISLHRQAGRGYRTFLSKDEERLKDGDKTCAAAITSATKIGDVNENIDERALLVNVGKRFKSRREAYNNTLAWSLREEIIAVPSKVWLLTIYPLFSERRLRQAQAEARSLNVPIHKVWPLSNAGHLVPVWGEISCIDFQLLVSAFFIIENSVFSRFKTKDTCVGPISVALTVARVATETKLLASILNRLKIVLHPYTALPMRMDRERKWKSAKDGSLTDIP